MEVKFLALEWLVLVPAWLVLAWMIPRARLFQPLRLICFLLLVLLLIEPRLIRASRGVDVVALIDQSESALEARVAVELEWLKLLEQDKGLNDQLTLLDFGEEVVARADGSEFSFDGKRNASRIATAIRFGQSFFRKDRSSRMVLLSDGYSTEPLGGLSDLLHKQQVTLDYRLMRPQEVKDFSVQSIELPSQVLPSEPFMIEVRVEGTTDEKIKYHIRKNGKRQFSGELEIQGGRDVLRWSDQMSQPGGVFYEVELEVEDAYQGNNRLGNWLESRGSGALLLVSSYADDPLKAMLQKQGIQVWQATDHRLLHAGSMAGFSGVLLNNVPASELPASFIEALPFYVREQGGGLFMFGGRYGFGSGGYFESAIDSLLPVSMELKEEHRKLSTAIGIVMDRSGSMGASVTGGATKMDLANEGVARTIELLGMHDAVTVFAVDSSAHEIVPLTRLQGNRQQLLDIVRRIQSMGGGIYVYTGMSAAWKQLKKAEQGQRHMILFSDAADSEEPGEYIRLLAEMRKEGATISVIALGDPLDADSGLLQDIAHRGGGRIFFNSNPSSLPALFAQETVSIARSAFITEPVPVKSLAGGWAELAGQPLNWLSQVGAYNLCYLREAAVASALSGDGYRAPLVAHWHQGVGRVGSVCFPVAGEHSDAVRSWPEYGDFMRTLGRWVKGADVPVGLGLRTEIKGSVLLLDLFYDSDWNAALSKSVPKLLTANLDESHTLDHQWRRLEPGRLHAAVDLKEGEAIRGVIQWEGKAIPFGPLGLGGNTEWRFDPARLQELQQLATATGGRELLDLTKIWQATATANLTDIRLPLLCLLLSLFLLEAFHDRFGNPLADKTFSKQKHPGGKAKQKPLKTQKAKKKKPRTPEARISDSVDENIDNDDDDRRSDRFAKAQRRGR